MTDRTQITRASLVLAAALALGAAAAGAQTQTFNVDLPRASPRAEVSQTVGVAEIRVDYHRPAVNERTVWGGLVPYGQVWRTGANENTLVHLSHDATVEGQPLAAGSYGFHAIPGESEWQIIFSHDTTAWGSFSYDESRDALRVTVKPSPAPHQESLLYFFDDVSNDGATLTLWWEKLRVPVRFAFDTHEQTLASIREQLKGLAQFNWQGWNQAAGYALQEEIAYEEALEWVDRSINAEERFENLSTKAQLLRKTGKDAEAEEIMARALGMGNAGQLHNYARQLLGQGEEEKALEIFKTNREKHPDVWFVELGLARAYSALGQFDRAVEAMKASHEKAPEPQKAYVQSLVDRLEKDEDIN